MWRNLDSSRLECHRILGVYAFTRGLVFLIFSVNGENTIQLIFLFKAEDRKCPALENMLQLHSYKSESCDCTMVFEHSRGDPSGVSRLLVRTRLLLKAVPPRALQPLPPPHLVSAPITRVCRPPRCQKARIYVASR